MSERRVMYHDKWDGEMTREELLDLVGVMLNERAMLRRTLIDKGQMRDIEHWHFGPIDGG
jgi:hypothetical protein